METEFSVHLRHMSLVPENFNLDKKALGQLLRSIRDEEMTSVRALARAAGLDFSHISKIELGRSDVSIGKFLRLCYALQLPPGLVLESCAVVGNAIYDVAFYNDDSVKERAKINGVLDHQKRKLISDYMSGIALALSYILKSSNPALMVDSLNFPVSGQRESFKKFLAEWLPSLSPPKRRALLRSIIIEGAKPLEQFGLLDYMQLNVYLEEFSRSKTRWIPRPGNPFFDGDHFTKSPLAAQVELLISAGREKPLRFSGKDIIDKQVGRAILGGVRSEKPKVPTWPELKNQIIQLTTKRGEKIALANQMKVSRQVLGNWLSDDSQGSPNAALTLKLLQWVQEQNLSKQKTADATNIGGTDPETKGIYENTISPSPPQRCGKSREITS